MPFTGTEGVEPLLEDDPSWAAFRDVPGPGSGRARASERNFAAAGRAAGAAARGASSRLRSTSNSSVPTPTSRRAKRSTRRCPRRGARSYRVNALAEPSMGPVQRQEYLYYTQQIGKQNAK
ncbi:hypothetical protein DFH11DRAFT_1731779 [Phellopilus nigrolimitatus]|nr:hypothetical protein DFH11DRAFT_1731779 [Phellopilus nigrolimitatus]